MIATSSRNPGKSWRVKDSCCANNGELDSAADGIQTDESPVKSKRGRMMRNPCAVCLEEIVDGKHEAIFCEGRCNMWYHRRCASVSQKLLQELTASEEPFLCLMCSRAAFKEEVSQLNRRLSA